MLHETKDKGNNNNNNNLQVFQLINGQQYSPEIVLWHNQGGVMTTGVWVKPAGQHSLRCCQASR